MRFHKLQNVQIALNYLKHRQVKGAAAGLPGPPGTPGLGVCVPPQSLTPPPPPILRR